MAFHKHVCNGVTLTRENFIDPPPEMSIVPFWFWNGDLDYDELEWQLREYHDRGVRSLFIHGRMGLAVPYLSEGWFDRVKFTVEKAREIGIDAWVYDEMDWPSGTAEKQVLEAAPELKQRYMELVALRFQGPIFTFLEAHDDRYVNTGDSEPIAAYGVRAEEYDTQIDDLVDLNKHIAWEKTLPWEAPEGDWVLMYFLEKTDPHYIDTLNPASTQKFIELTHERYKSSVGSEFGKTVPGFFTDEPAMYYYHVGLDNYVVPWSRQMFRIFRERRGYDLKPFLPALYCDMGEKTVEVRYDFWRTLTEQYAETYYGQLRTWCEDNDLIFTGHLLFEEYLRLAARCEGNIFTYLKYFHMTGVDHLYPKIGTREDPSQHVALKLASSAAHHYGSPRLLCESMGGTYWDCTLERMKWMNNWEYVLGVNLFNNHGYHYTIEGDRKRDWPPSQFYHHTWWPYYDRFTTYNARLSHLLTGGRHVAKLLVLYPIRSIWTNYVPQNQTPVGELIEREFQYLTDILLRLHIDFDYVDEDVLTEATIEDGTIRIRDEEFEAVLLPPLTHVLESTHDLLDTFVQGGGHVLADSLLPHGLLEAHERADGSVHQMDAFLGADREAPETGAWEVSERGAGSVRVYRGDGLKGHDETLREALLECFTPDVTISDEHVFYLHRQKDDFDIYFLVNTLQEDRGRVRVSLERTGTPELWDPNTGEVQPLFVYDLVDGRLEFELDFPPSESHVVILRDELPEKRVTAANFHVSSLEPDRVRGFIEGEDRPLVHVATSDGTSITSAAKASGSYHEPLELPDSYRFSVREPNVLAVDRWKMNIQSGGDDVSAWHRPAFDDGDWLDVTHGAWETQLPVERDEDAYPVDVWYRTSFDVGHVPDDPRLLIDGFAGERFRLFVNGREMDADGSRSWLDAEIRELDISDVIHEGSNSVVVCLTVRRRTDGMLDLLKIAGSFGVEGSLEDGYRITELPATLRTGDWTGQGFPLFSGTGVYEAEIDIPETMLDGGRILLEADCGEDVLGVTVNGGDERTAPWNPYRIDITDQLSAGANRFRISVTNTLLNVLEGVEKESGLFGPPVLIHQRPVVVEVGE